MKIFKLNVLYIQGWVFTFLFIFFFDKLNSDPKKAKLKDSN